MKIRTYSELVRLKTFEERFRYLRLRGSIGVSTFGFDRYLNQAFYQSTEWKRVRDVFIVRDNSWAWGIPDREIFDNIRIHHMNPITVNDLEAGSDILLDPEFLICTSLDTHNAIHFGDENNLIRLPRERTKGDTTPW